MKDLEISKIADQENYIISFQISKSLNLMKMSFEIWGEIRSGPLGGTPQNNISRAELRAMWPPPSVQRRTQFSTALWPIKIFRLEILKHFPGGFLNQGKDLPRPLVLQVRAKCVVEQKVVVILLLTWVVRCYSAMCHLECQTRFLSKS